MSTTADVDLGLLSWVKGEIDLALGRAGEALQTYTAAPEDTATLKLAITQLHQAHGALAIVGLQGVTQFSDGLEQLLAALENGKLNFSAEIVSTAQKALIAIQHYLDDLITGSPNQPLRLLPVYQEISDARGLPPAQPSDLFFPDLSLRPPRREQAVAELPPEGLKTALRSARMAFQRGLLKWLRKDPLGLAEMRGAIASIEGTENQPSKRAIWWITQGLIDSLISTNTPATDSNTRKLCARVDTQIRKFIEGSGTVAERLLRDVLYQVAVAPAGGEHLECIRAAYRLTDQLPASGGDNANIDKDRPLLRTLRELIAGAKDDWNRFCSGTAAALPPFNERAKNLAEQSSRLAQADFILLAQALAEIANLLRKDPLRHDESIALEVATALLLADNALETYPATGSNFAQQVDAMCERLSALARGEKLDTLALPQLDEISRQAQERLLMGQVVREIAVNMGVIEQALDAFFRDEEKVDGLSALTKPLDQIAGALTILGQDRAVVVLRECEKKIAAFARPGETRDAAEFEDVAKKLSGIGFFVEQLRYGAADLDAILNPAKAEPLTITNVGSDLDVTKRLTQTLVGALRDNPEDHGLRNELKQNLESLRDDAQLMADAGLEQQANAAIQALRDGNASQPELDEVMAPLVAVPDEQVVPSAEITRLASVSEEELDAELLGIFLEEAEEVLGTLNSTLPQLIEAPHDVEALTTIRRSFHTLKGSGRMVGLTDLGEVAWNVEQVMNAWLQQEVDATPALQDMLGYANSLFGDWVEQLSQGNLTAPDVAELLSLCAKLQQPQDIPAATAPEDLPIPAESDDAVEEAFELLKLEAELTASTEATDAELTTELGRESSAEIGRDLTEEVAPLEFEEPEQETLVSTETPNPDTAVVLDFPTPPPVQLGELSVPASLFELYLGETRSHIATLQAEFTLDYDPPSEPMVRAAHTLTGISATVGIMPVHYLGGALEGALMRFAEAQQPIPDDQHDLIARAIGAIDGMVGVVAARRMPTEDIALSAALDALQPTPTSPIETPKSFTTLEELSAPVTAASEEIEAAPLEPDTFSPTEARLEEQSTAAPVYESSPLPTPEQSEAANLLLHEDEIDEQLLPFFLEESVDLMRDIGQSLRAWREQPGDAGIADQLQRSLHTFKGSARMAGAMNLGELVHGMESRIAYSVDAGNSGAELLESLDAAYDQSALILDHLRRGDAVPVAALAPMPDVAIPATNTPIIVAPKPRAERLADEEASSENVLRVRAALIDEMVNGAGEIAIARTRIEDEVRTLKGSLLDLTENVIRLRAQLREIEIQAETQMQSHESLIAEQNQEFDPLEFDRFTRFQELTRMMAESVNDVSTVQHNLLRNLEHTDAALAAQSRLNRDLSQSLMGVRMVPFNSVVDRLYRVVRQSAKDTQKRANLEIVGGQTELDRSVLERMVAPLEHLLRNAIAHGLETPEIRRAAGKDDIGEITLSLTQTGNEILIVLKDDGAGLNYERIRAKGEASGLLVAGENADETTLTRLIFEPGFSTADEVTALAGRGVGMDVVKSETVNLGGRLDAVSEQGVGTTFSIYLPLTLAVAQTLLLRVDQRTYAVPSSMVAQANELAPAAIERIREAGFIEWMGNRYPYRYLKQLLGRPDEKPEPARRHWLLLLKTGNQFLALEVDGLLGNREVVVKNIGPQLARVTGIAGATVLGNGEIALILNPIALASRAPVSTQSLLGDDGIAISEAKPAAPHVPTVMIVDDSLTVRKITGRLLERNGYNVITTKDGIEALEFLAEQIPDVMLVDIEMPRMDGFDLTRNIRADARLKNIPIVMITSRTADKHRNYAMEIGVNEYLGKPYDEEKLLKLVAEHIPL